MLSLKNKILQKQDIPFNQKIRCFIFYKIIITLYIYPTSNALYGDVVQCGSSVLENPLKKVDERGSS